ncbi:response regulator [Aquibaculum arenosum]|uniref:response regulator n=1 Tax=Aquibaculum arenosum TaxID=3032591 RepID=UPI003F58AAF5
MGLTALQPGEERPHILVVDDDTRLRELLKRFLTDQGLRVTTAGDAAEARRTLAGVEFDLIVLDIMMPGEDGLELTRWLRQERRAPVLLLTAMDEVDSRIAGLESGADDYLAKPFEPRELILRIQAILRRAAAGAGEPGNQRVFFGEFVFDLARTELRRGEALVHLTAVEAQLLSALARNPGVPVAREDLAAVSPDIGNQRSIDVQMTRLRRKIERDPKMPRYLLTVRGTGYVLEPD